MFKISYIICLFIGLLANIGCNDTSTVRRDDKSQKNQPPKQTQINTPPHYQNQIYTLADFMKEAASLSKTNDADFDKVLETLTLNYHKISNKENLPKEKINGANVFHLLFSNKITPKLANFVETVYRAPKEPEALIKDKNSFGQLAIQVLVINTKNNDPEAFLKLLIFLLEKNHTQINFLNDAQKDQVFSTDSVYKEQFFKELKDKESYIRHAFLENKHAIIKTILSGLFGTKREELMSSLITEATKEAAKDKNHANKLVNMLQNSNLWGFRLDEYDFDIMKLIANNLKDNINNQNIKDLMRLLATTIKDKLNEPAKWPSFANKALTILSAPNALNSVKKARDLLRIGKPYESFIEDLKAGRAPSNGIVTFLSHGNPEDINDFASLQIDGETPIFKIAKLPANEDNSSIFLLAINKISNVPGFRENIISVLVKNTGDREYIKNAMTYALDAGASLASLKDFSEIEKILNMVKGNLQAFRTLDLSFSDRATDWAFANKDIFVAKAWKEMYQRDTDAQKMKMRSKLLAKFLNPIKLKELFATGSDWGLEEGLQTDIYEINGQRGKLFEVVIKTIGPGYENLKKIYSGLMYFPEALIEAFKATPDARDVGVWAHEKHAYSRVQKAFKDYLTYLKTDSVKNKDRISELKNGLIGRAGIISAGKALGTLHSGYDLTELKKEAAEWGLDPSEL